MWCKRVQDGRTITRRPDSLLGDKRDDDDEVIIRI